MLVDDPRPGELKVGHEACRRMFKELRQATPPIILVVRHAEATTPAGGVVLRPYADPPHHPRPKRLPQIVGAASWSPGQLPAMEFRQVGATYRLSLVGSGKTKVVEVRAGQVKPISGIVLFAHPWNPKIISDLAGQLRTLHGAPPIPKEEEEVRASQHRLFGSPLIGSDAFDWAVESPEHLKIFAAACSGLDLRLGKGTGEAFDALAYQSHHQGGLAAPQPSSDEEFDAGVAVIEGIEGLIDSVVGQISQSP